MKFLIYEMYLQSPKTTNDIYVLNDDNFIAILIDELPKSKNERIAKINELRKNYKLKLIEITQNQFLNFMKNKNMMIKEINFENELESEDKEEIEKYLRNKNYEKLLNKINKDRYYYYISSIEIELKEEELTIDLKKNLEIEILDNSFNRYSLNEIFDILEGKKIISTLVKQKDEIWE